MSTFTIDNDNNITAYAGAEQVTPGEGIDLIQFASAAALAKISANWPLSRWVEIWNSIPGHTPVKKFQDRRKAVARVWSAIQPLATLSEAATTQSEPGTAVRTPAEQRKSAQHAKHTAADHRNKKEKVIGLMKRPKGATLAEIMQITDWQKHTVRGFVSLLGSQGGWNIESTTNAAGERTYKIFK